MDDSNVICSKVVVAVAARDGPRLSWVGVCGGPVGGFGGRAPHLPEAAPKAPPGDFRGSRTHQRPLNSR